MRMMDGNRLKTDGLMIMSSRIGMEWNFSPSVGGDWTMMEIDLEEIIAIVLSSLSFVAKTWSACFNYRFCESEICARSQVGPSGNEWTERE